MSIISRINSLFSLRRKIILVVVIVLIPAAVLEIWSLNRLATFGPEISKIEGVKRSLILENQLLKNEIAEKSSLKQMEQIAKAYGFEKISKIEYIKPQDLVNTN